jgi:hypothetical protein
MKFYFLGRGMTAAVIVLSFAVPMRTAAQASSQIGRTTGATADAMIKEAESKPTPHGADGHPDLNGFWNYTQMPKNSHVDAKGDIHIGVPKIPVTLQPRRTDPNPPPYKPELLDKVKSLGEHEVDEDPAFHCIPLGIPRAGPPRQIVQTAKVSIFLYQIDAGIGDQPGSYRLIPMDGRKHRDDVDPSYFGDSVGHWEGDTLVVDATEFNDQTWLAGGDDGSGYFHSDQMHVVERYTRKGNTLRWEATVQDPKVLTKPWQVTPETLVLADDMVYEQPICEEREAKHIVDRY